MTGLVLVPWPASYDPSEHKDGQLVLQLGKDLYAAKVSSNPGFWAMDQLPASSSLRVKHEIGMFVTLNDVPLGKTLAVPVGKTEAGPIEFWMCPCGTRYVQNKEGDTSKYSFPWRMRSDQLLLGTNASRF